MAMLGGGADTSAADNAARREEEEARRLEKQNKARIRNRRSRTSGRRALLALVDDLGKPGDLRSTLG
ncbi:MAG: hypothetical protein P1U37_09040 [Minwuia sp.]|nr:hypothetical protein [Minwuia sp.]